MQLRRPALRPWARILFLTRSLVSSAATSELGPSAEPHALTPKATKVSRALFALFTAFVLVVTFYPAALGLGYALDASADLRSRAAGALFFLPSVTLFVLLVGMLPLIRGRLLFGLGVVGSLLLLPSFVASVTLNLAAAVGAGVELLSLGTWWLLAWPKVSRQRSPSDRRW